ncbi:MAG: hypothetical protein ABI348_01330 [Nitrososphaera sp.]
MKSKQELLQEITEMLKKHPERMYSREEIMNLLSESNSDSEIETLLAELEVANSMKESKSDVYATCRGGTVYYKWNR